MEIMKEMQRTVQRMDSEMRILREDNARLQRELADWKKIAGDRTVEILRLMDELAEAKAELEQARINALERLSQLNQRNKENEALRADNARLRGALEAIHDTESESCRRCEGSGALYADGKAHYPSEYAPTRSCPQCGGEGRTPPDDCQEIARAALAGGPR